MQLLRYPETYVWLVLVALTAVSFLAQGTTHADDSGTRNLATLGVFALSAIKVRLVMTYFMEVRRSPLALRLICDGWLLVTGLAIMAEYWFGFSSRLPI